VLIAVGLAPSKPFLGISPHIARILSLAHDVPTLRCKTLYLRLSHFFKATLISRNAVSGTYRIRQ
jgi:hypothetical protein